MFGNKKGLPTVSAGPDQATGIPPKKTMCPLVLILAILSILSRGKEKSPESISGFGAWKGGLVEAIKTLSMILAADQCGSPQWFRGFGGLRTQRYLQPGLP